MIAPEKHLAYATGYIALELHAEAHAELAHLSPELLEEPAALAVRIELAMSERNWQEVVMRSGELVNHDATVERPWITWAYALRELRLIADAQETLTAGARLIDNPSPLVAYNLACYACLLGELDEARHLLASVYARDKKWREIARNDPDLAALHLKKK